VADELLTLEQRHEAFTGTVQASQSSLRTRAHSLHGLLDEVLGAETRHGLGAEARHDTRRTG
jgi:hypothetical protein